MNLLIVDDLAANRRLLRAQLELEGYTILEAGNGVEALAQIERGDVEGIISDILMPEMDGFRLCLELRSHARFAATPFILYTSTYNSPSDRDLSDKVGADAYLTKPSPTAVILAALHEASTKERVLPYPLRRQADEKMVLRQYNEALVRKLEEKNNELLLAFDRVNELNDDLERRVQLRTLELESANRELEAFSYTVAHDLRSPLAAISGFMRLLQHSFAGSLPEQGQHYLEVISANIRRMTLLIDDLLRLAQMGRHQISRQSVDLRVVAEVCVQALREEYPDRAVDVEIAPLPVCDGDPVLLQQLMHNLVSNAFKYTGKAEHARIEIGFEERDGGWVVFVRDNGAGFDMKYADRLFSTFQRLHSKRDFEGTGVGLAIVDRIVKRHGGRVWATGEPGRGGNLLFFAGGGGQVRRSQMPAFPSASTT